MIKFALLLMPLCLAMGSGAGSEGSTNDINKLRPKTKVLPPSRLDLLTVSGPLLKSIGIGAQTKIKVDRNGNKWYFDENNNEWLHLPLEVDPLPVGPNINEDESDERLPDIPNVFQALMHLKGQSRPTRGPPLLPQNYPEGNSQNSDYDGPNSMGVISDDHKGVYGPFPPTPDGFGLPDEEDPESDEGILTWEELNQAAHHYPWPGDLGFPLPIFPERPSRDRVTRRTTTTDDIQEDVPKEVTKRQRRTRRPARVTTPLEYEEYDDSNGLIPPFIPPHNDYDFGSTTPDYEEYSEPTKAVRQPLLSLKPILKPGRGPLRRTRGPTDPWNVFTQSTVPSAPIVSVNTVIEAIRTSTGANAQASSAPPDTTPTITTSTADPVDQMKPIIPEMPDMINQISNSSEKPIITDNNILAVINQIVSNALNAANAANVAAIIANSSLTTTTSVTPSTTTTTPEPTTQPSTKPTTTPPTTASTTESTSTEITSSKATQPQETPSSQLFVKIPTTADPWQLITLGKRKTPVIVVDYPTIAPVAQEVWRPVMGPYNPIKPSPVFSIPPNQNQWVKPEADVVSTLTTRGLLECNL